MEGIDTDIDNYSHREILELLKLPQSATVNMETLVNQVKPALSMIQDNEDIDPTTRLELLDFFKKCFMRISVVNGLTITDDVRTQLNLPRPKSPIPHQAHPSHPHNQSYPHNQSSSLAPSPSSAPLYPSQKLDPNSSSAIASYVTSSLPPILEEPPIIHKAPYQGSLPTMSPDRLAIQTVNSEYARGLVNPIRRETITTTLTINSKFRVNTNNLTSNFSQSDRLRIKTLCYTNNNSYRAASKTTNCNASTNEGSAGETSDFTVELMDPYKDVVALKLASIELLNTYYPFSVYLKTNELTITTFDYDPAAPSPPATKANITTTRIEIPEGDYTVTQLVSALNTAFTTSTVTALTAVQVVYDTIKGKIYFQVNPAPPTPPPAGRAYGFDLDFAPANTPERPEYLNMGWMIGFQNLTYDFFTDYVATATTTLDVGFNPEAIANLMGTSFYLLEVDDFNNNNPNVVNYNCNTFYSFNIRNILAKVPNTAPSTSIIFEDSSDRIFKKRVYFGPVRIKKLRIRLLDENGRTVNLNNGDISVTFEITSLDSPYKNMIE